MKRALPRLALALAAAFALAEALPYLFMLSGSQGPQGICIPDLWPELLDNYATVLRAPMALVRQRARLVRIVLMQVPLVLLAACAHVPPPAARTVQTLVLACLLSPQVRFVQSTCCSAARALDVLRADRPARGQRFRILWPSRRAAARWASGGPADARGLHIVFRIVAPLIRPTLAFALFSVVCLDDYFWTLVAASSTGPPPQSGPPPRRHRHPLAPRLAARDRDPPPSWRSSPSPEHLVRAFAWNAPR
jgi:hypothetical protein